jgi:hypothetical protein
MLNTEVARKGRCSILVVLIYYFIIDSSKGVGYMSIKEEVEDDIIAIHAIVSM